MNPLFSGHTRQDELTTPSQMMHARETTLFSVLVIRHYRYCTSICPMP